MESSSNPRRKNDTIIDMTWKKDVYIRLESKEQERR